MTGWTGAEALGRAFGDVFRIIDSTNPEHTVNPMTVGMQENKTVGLSASCTLIRRDVATDGTFCASRLPH
jgi:hypothetical protein